MNETTLKYKCNFCGKSQQEVEKLISGPGVFICDQCLVSGYNMLDKSSPVGPSHDNIHIPFAWDIKKSLDQVVSGQHHVKIILSVQAVNHLKRLKFNSKHREHHQYIQKSNILLLGKTGTGKTLLCRTLSDIIQVPMAIVDATSITESGYQGNDVEVILEQLLLAAHGDLAWAQRGIVVIDEMDKKANSKAIAGGIHDVSRSGVQQSLLKLVENNTITIQPPGTRDAKDRVEFNTAEVLFVFTGTFQGLEDIIRARTRSHEIVMGFHVGHQEKRYSNQLMEAVAQDFIDYGIIPEFMSRVGTIAVLHDLRMEDMKNIMVGVDNNQADQIKRLAIMDDINLEFHPDFINGICAAALKLRMGGRAVRGLLDRETIDMFYRIHELKKSGVHTVRYRKYLEPPEFIMTDGSSVLDTKYNQHRGN